MKNEKLKAIITAANGELWVVTKSSIRNVTSIEHIPDERNSQKIVRTTQLTSRGLTFTNLQSVEFIGFADKWCLTNCDNTIEFLFDEETWQMQLHRQYCNNDNFENLKKYYEL